MVIAYLHVMSVAAFPAETNPPLLIYADAVLSLPVPAQLFKPVAGWESKVVYILNGMDNHQLVMRPLQNIRRDILGPVAEKYPLRVLIRKALNHAVARIV